MATSEEKLQILRMIESGKITAEEGKKLLEALGKRPGEAAGTGTRAKWVRIRVTSKRSGKPRVNVNLPIQLVDMGLRVAEHHASDLDDIDFGEIRRLIDSGVQGKLVEVDDEEQDQHVEIFVE